MNLRSNFLMVAVGVAMLSSSAQASPASGVVDNSVSQTANGQGINYLNSPQDNSVDNSNHAAGGAVNNSGNSSASLGIGNDLGGHVGNVTTGPSTSSVGANANSNTNAANNSTANNANNSVRNDVNNSVTKIGSDNQTNTVLTNTTDVNTNANIQGQAQDSHNEQSQLSVSNVSDSGNSANSNTQTNEGNNADQTMVYNEAKAPKPAVNTAYAAPAVVGGGVCAYTPFSGGLTLRIVSGSATGAIIDKGCESRANADVLARLGYTQEAVALLMQNEAVAKAFEVVRAQKNSEKASYVLPQTSSPSSTSTILLVPNKDVVKGIMLPIPN